MIGTNHPARVDPAPIRKPNIHQDDLWLQSRGFSHSRGHSAGLTDDLKCPGFSEQGSQTNTKDFVIVYQQEPNWFRLRLWLHHAPGARSQMIRVPWPESDMTSRRPPSALARFSIFLS